MEVIVDQGGEFTSYLNDLFEQHGIDSRALGAHAPWQHGVTERHGGLLGTMWRKMVYEHYVEGSWQCVVCLSEY